MNEEDFHYENGQYHCSNEDCDWWVPEGMEYMSEKHDCEEYAELTLEEFFESDSKEWTVSDEVKEEWDERAEEVTEGEEGEDWVPIDEVDDPINADEPVSELDAENDDLDDIPSQKEIESAIDDIEMANGDSLEERIEKLDEDSRMTLEELRERLNESEGADIKAMLDDVPMKEEIDNLIDDVEDDEEEEDVIDGVDLDDHMDDLIDGDAVDEMCEEDEE